MTEKKPDNDNTLLHVLYSTCISLSLMKQILLQQGTWILDLPLTKRRLYIFIARSALDSAKNLLYTYVCMYVCMYGRRERRWKLQGGQVLLYLGGEFGRETLGI